MWSRHLAPRALFGLIVLHGAVANGAKAQVPVNLSYVVQEDSWTNMVAMLKAFRENGGYDGDDEAGVPWKAEIVALSAVRAMYPSVPDTSALKSFFQSRWEARRNYDRSDYFAVLFSDPDYAGGVPMRQIYDPAVAGVEIGWGDSVPTDDHLSDFNGDGKVEAIVWRVPVHDAAEVQSVVHKTIEVLLNQGWDDLPSSRQPAPLRDDVDAGLRPEELALIHTWGERVARRQSSLAENWYDYLARIDVLVEDADRDGRDGAWCRSHAQANADAWSSYGYQTFFAGDPDPTYYWTREAFADSLVNRGRQVYVTYGTAANRWNVIYYWDQRPGYGWDVDHLTAEGVYYVHIGLSCGLGDIDRSDTYGRPHPEKILLPEDRGAYAVIGPTRQMYEWTYDWVGKAFVNRLAPRAINFQRGATLGRVWRDVKNSMCDEIPNHRSERMSLIGLGDPTAKVVRGPGTPTDAGGSRENGAVKLALMPNPTHGVTSIRYSLPHPGSVDIAIFDVTGRVVRRLCSGSRGAGTHVVTWDGRSENGMRSPAGVYFLRVNVLGSCQSLPVVLVR